MPAAEPRELRLATLLFSDLSGFTRMSEGHDPEEVADVVDALFRRFRPLIEGAGGTIDKFIGDAVMAVFGAPVAHPDDAAQAVRAGLAMQREIELFNRERGLALRMRVGINTGNVLWGTVAGAAATAMGDPVSVAQRLESAAPLGGVLVSAETARAAGARFRFAGRGAVALKGRDGTVEALEALEEAAATGTPAEAAPFVGRVEELARLVAGARSGCGLFVVLEGTAGVGKSRLLAELRAAGNVGTVILGRASENPRMPLAALADAIRSEAGVSGLAVDDAARVVQSLETVLGASIPEAAEREGVAHLLALSIGCAPRESPFRDMEPDRRAAETRRAWSRWAGARLPALLCIEDLHSADEMTRTMLEGFAKEFAGRPFSIVATARPGGVLPAGFERIALGELRAPDVARLAAGILGANPSPELARFLVDATAGNPLYVEHLARYLKEEGLLEGDPPRLRGGPTRLPQGLQNLLVARLDALGREEKDAVKSASVVGRAFWLRLLEKLVGRDVKASVAEARRREMIAPQADSVLPGDSQYVFRHALLRDAAYSLLTRKDRVRLHGLAAGLLEARIADGGRAVRALAARHREAAGEPAAAAEHWLACASESHGDSCHEESLASAREATRLLDSAAARHATANALLSLDRYEEALAELARAPEDTSQVAGNAALLRAAARLGIGRTQEALSEADRAVAALDTGLPAFQALKQRAGIRFRLGEFEKAAADLEAARGVLAGVKGMPDRQRRLQEAHLAQEEAGLCRDRGDYRRAHSLFGRAAEEYRALGNAFSLSRALNGLGTTHARLGEGAASIAAYRESLLTRRSVGDRFGTAFSLNNLGVALHSTSDFPGAQACWEESLAIGRELGNPYLTAVAMSNLGMGLRVVGEYGKALLHLREALAIRESTGDRPGQAFVNGELAATLINMGKAEEALFPGRDAVDIQRALGNRPGLGHALYALANALTWSGRAAEAVPLAIESTDIFKSISERRGEAQALFVLARAHQELGDRATALVRCRESLAHWQALGDRAAATRTTGLISELEAP